MDSKELRKRVLKTLPIWDQDASRVKIELDQLEFDVQIHLERVQASVASYDALPAIPTNSKSKSRCKQYNDEDIVKLYRRHKSGELLVETEERVQEPKEDKHTVSTINRGSIELLSSRPQSGELVYAMVEENEPWVKCKIKAVFHKAVDNRPVTIFSVMRLDERRSLSVSKFCVARIQDHGEDLRAPKRVIAGKSETEMRSGIIGQEPCDANSHRYMVLLDNGTCRYFKPEQVYPIFYQSEIPWKDFHHLGVRDEHLEAELNYFFKNYPRRMLIKPKLGQQIDVSRNGVFVPAVVIGIDCDTIKIVFKDQTEQRLFRGCTRLLKSAQFVSRLTKSDISYDKLYDKLAGNIKRYYDAGSAAIGDEYLKFIENFSRNLKVCGTNVARKSTARREAEPRMKVCFDDSVVFDDRETCPFLSELLASEKHAPKCTPDCLVQPGMRTEADIDDIVAEFRNVSDLKVPFKLGWKKILVRAYRGRQPEKKFVYKAPCGRVLKVMADIKKCLQQTRSKMDVDYFTLDKEIIHNRAVGERSAFFLVDNIAVDKSSGKPLENKLISALNPVCEEELPIDFEYRNETFPHPMLKAKSFSFNEDFKSGCDCEDDCSQRSSCACHRLIEQIAGSNKHDRGTVDAKLHYKYKRLPDQVSTGIFECNKFCRCSSKCPNRVVQNGIRVRMQVRKTIDKGWGVFTLDDIPKGTFICTYSAELLDDADQYGNCDMYYADLDYITIVENQKLIIDSDEGVDPGDESENEDPARAKNPTKSKKRPLVRERSSDSSVAGDEDDVVYSTPPPDDEYMPRMGPTYPCRYPKRASKPIKRKGQGGSGGGGGDEEANGRRKPQFKKIHSLLRDKSHSQDYTLDARLAGNIGRFFNHCCDASMYPQNVFIETHDPRLPVIAFFTKRALKADDELTWHYAYTIDSIPGRMIICKCGASNCAGRLL